MNGRIFKATIENSMEHLDLIKKLVDEEKITESIIEQLENKALETKLKMVFDFVKSKVEFKDGAKNGKRTLYSNVDDYIERGHADVDGIAVVLGVILKKMDIPFNYRMVKFENKADYSHVYLIVPKKGRKDLNRRSNYFVMDLLMEKFDQECEGETGVYTTS